MKADLFFDGACKGNPGPSSSGWLLQGDVALEGGRYLGEMTNNEAEYLSLVDALIAAKDAGVEELRVHGDSQLVLMQVAGQWRCKKEHLQVHLSRVKALIKAFKRVEIHWVERAANAEADALANKALRSHQ